MSRVRPWLRRAAVVAFLLAVPVVALQVWDYVELRRLVGEVQAIIDRGEPVTEREAGFEYEPSLSEEPRRLFAGRYYVAGAVLAPREVLSFDAYGFLRSVHNLLGGPDTGRPPEAETAAAREMLEWSAALGLADTAASLEFRGFPAGTEFNYRVQGLINLAVLIAARTVVLSLDGDGNGAVESALGALAMRPALGEWIEMTGPASHETAAILSWSKPSVEALERLQDRLADDDQQSAAVADLLRERAEVIESLWRRYYGTHPNVPGLYTLPRRSVAESLLRPWISRRFVAVLRVWADLVDAAREPWARHPEALEDIMQAHAIDPEELPLRLFWPRSVSLSKAVAIDTFERVMRRQPLVEDRAAAVAVAVERYRRDHADALPGALTDLVPEYLSEVPMDPQTEQPLLYRQERGAYVIYGVGPDGTDDGGILLRATAFGSLRAFVQGPDIGVRVLTGESLPQP